MGCSSSSVSKSPASIRDESIDDFYFLDDDDVLGQGRNEPVVRCVRLSDKREFAAKTVPRDAQSLREQVDGYEQVIASMKSEVRSGRRRRRRRDRASPSVCIKP